MMLELTEAGWCNLLNLFLTLALVTDTEDVTSRIVDLLDMVGPLTEKSVSSLVIRGCFVLCLINEEKETDASSLAHRLSLYFTAACREISVASSDSRRHQWYNQIAVYLEGIEELRVVHPALIGEGFKMVFSCCRDQELRKVLLVLTQAIDSFCHRIMQTPITSADEVSASAWWKNVFPFVKSHVMTLTPSSQLTNLAVSFTRLARHLPPEGSTGVHETYLTCLEYFGFDESVSASVSTSFLWQMSNNQELEQLSDVEARIIQTLFRCCVQTSLQNASMSSTEHLQQLAQLVLALPKFRQEFSSAGMQLPTGPEHPHAVIMAFIKALSASYAQSASLLEKRNLQLKAESYLGNVAAHAGKVLKSANPDELKTAYSLVGRLIKNCSLLLYSKTRPDCILVEVIETMLFPRSLTSSKQGLHPAVQHAIREHLILVRMRPV
ncbi:PREDICTED: protein MMS22-like isoform X2 [Priapulus caudatus]|uniref:Protein MMS22-like n=1 Tax=Priapulus caudatus TaxID=37621 RepID=A0ABM1DRE2_PRICU|nr:PREDICTED: protein MMS22-like isoform X2 [Priapulus caudatus]